MAVRGARAKTGFVNKVRTTIYLPAQIIEKWRESGINQSQYLEELIYQDQPQLRDEVRAALEMLKKRNQ